MIRQLYAVEKLAKTRAENDKDFSFDDRKALRLQKAKPVLDTFKQWLDRHKDDVVPKSAIGKANDLPMIEWLTFVLEELPRCTNDDERRALLPHRFDIKRLKGKI